MTLKESHLIINNFNSSKSIDMRSDITNEEMEALMLLMQKVSFLTAGQYGAVEHLVDYFAKLNRRGDAKSDS